MSEPTVDPRAVTPVFAWHVPVLGDVPNVPADITALATGIEATVLKGTPIFATAAARNTAIPAPVAGQFCYVADVKQYQGYDTSWYPVGGVMPSAGITYPGGSVPVGWTNLIGGTASVQGGITYNPATGAFTLPSAGIYLASVLVGTASTTLAVRPGMTVNGVSREGPFAAPSAIGNSQQMVWQFAAAAGHLMIGKVWAQNALTVWGDATIHWVGRN